MTSDSSIWKGRTHWVIPLCYVTITLIVGMAFPRLEHRHIPGLVSTMSAPSAMSICSAIASGMISLTGIVFSLTFVMVQFSATAYSPRLVLWLARDPVMSHALGVFSATFLYALMFLAWVDRGAEGSVPLLSGWLVLALLLASMGMFIALIDRVGLLQVNRMLVFTGDQGRKAIEEWHEASRHATPAAETELIGRSVTGTLLHAGRPRVVQSVDGQALLRWAMESDAVIELSVIVGDTVFEGTPLLRIRGAQGIRNEGSLRDAIRLGDERTFEQDPKFALRLVVDIAIKALSPAINDPTTAVQALDQVEDLLLRLGREQLEACALRDPSGTVRLVARIPTWEDFLRLGLEEIGQYGADSVQVMRRMMALKGNLVAVLPESRHPALRHIEERLRGSIARSFTDADAKREATVADRQGLGAGATESAGPTAGVATMSGAANL